MFSLLPEEKQQAQILWNALMFPSSRFEFEEAHWRLAQAPFNVKSAVMKCIVSARIDPELTAEQNPFK